jgi:hypothetical protein
MTMTDMLIKPTVGDVIAFLQTLPPDAPFRIEDADTSWTISTIHTRIDGGGVVWFLGEYPEMEQELNG